jgi:hypothetical protein
MRQITGCLREAIMELYLRRKMRQANDTPNTSSTAILLKAQDYKDKKWHYDHSHQPVQGSRPDGHRGYHHEAHEDMFAFHTKSHDRKRTIRKDAHEQVKNGATQGHVAAHGLQHTLEDFIERIESAPEAERDNIITEMHDWLSYIHAQHGLHGLDKDPEFRRAYKKAHNLHSQLEGTKE